MSQKTTAPAPYNLFDPEAIANLYPLYHRLRAEAPVYWDEERQQWLLTRYVDITDMLRDPRLSAAMLPSPDSAELEQRRLVLGIISKQVFFKDPPNHTRLRGLMDKAFTPQIVAGMRERVQQIADGLLDAVQGSGRMDIIRDLAAPLPLTVIAELLSVPAEARAEFRQWTGDYIRVISGAPATLEEEQQTLQRLLALTDYLRVILEQRLKEPKPDLITALALAEEQGDRLSQQEILSNAMLLLVAGYATTTDMICTGLLALLRNPDQMQKLQDDPTLIESAVEEFLRYESPVQFAARRATEDIELHGKQIRKGQVVLFMLGAANRDPERFPEPDRLDITRTNNRHLAFGYGPHWCTGAPLPRMNAQIAISTVLRRLPGLRLETDSLEWNDTLLFRGLKSLPVTF